MQASDKYSMTVMDLVILTHAEPGEIDRLCYSNPYNHGPLILSEFCGRDNNDGKIPQTVAKTLFPNVFL